MDYEKKFKKFSLKKSLVGLIDIKNKIPAYE